MTLCPAPCPHASPDPWFEEHASDVSRLVAWRCRGTPTDRIEELTQEAHLRIQGRWSKWTVEGPNRGWVPTVVRSTISDAARYRHVRPDLDPTEADAAEIASPQEGDPLEELFECERAEVLEALAQLRQEWRDPLELHLLQGWSQKQIAEHLHIASPDAVSKRIGRGIAALRKHFGV